MKEIQLTNDIKHDRKEFRKFFKITLKFAKYIQKNVEAGNSIRKSFTLVKKIYKPNFPCRNIDTFLQKELLWTIDIFTNWLSLHSKEINSMSLSRDIILIKEANIFKKYIEEKTNEKN